MCLCGIHVSYEIYVYISVNLVYEWCSCMVYVSHLYLYMQCVLCMCRLCVGEVASVFWICGVSLVSVVCMWSVFV